MEGVVNMRGSSNNRALTRKNIFIGLLDIYVHSWEVVAYWWWSHVEVQLYLIKRKLVTRKKAFLLRKSEQK